MIEQILIAIGIGVLAINTLLCYCALCVASEEDRWMEEHRMCEVETDKNP